jgi:hypothetical protein
MITGVELRDGGQQRIMSEAAARRFAESSIGMHRRLPTSVWMDIWTLGKKRSEVRHMTPKQLEEESNASAEESPLFIGA